MSTYKFTVIDVSDRASFPSGPAKKLIACSMSVTSTSLPHVNIATGARSRRLALPKDTALIITGTVRGLLLITGGPDHCRLPMWRPGSRPTILAQLGLRVQQPARRDPTRHRVRSQLPSLPRRRQRRLPPADRPRSHQRQTLVGPGPRRNTRMGSPRRGGDERSRRHLTGSPLPGRPSRGSRQTPEQPSVVGSVVRSAVSATVSRNCLPARSPIPSRI
jgi:hypothetical protein